VPYVIRGESAASVSAAEKHDDAGEVARRAKGQEKTEAGAVTADATSTCLNARIR